MASLEQRSSLSVFATFSEHDGGGEDTLQIILKGFRMSQNEFAMVKAQAVSKQIGLTIL